MSVSNTKLSWLAVRSLAEYSFAGTLIYLIVSFFDAATKSEVSTNKALVVFISSMALVIYLIACGIYHTGILFSMLDEKFSKKYSYWHWKISTWQGSGSVALGIFLFMVGFIILYSSYEQYRHFFTCLEVSRLNYWHSAVLSIASIAGTSLALLTMFVGVLFAVKRGRL